MDIRFRAYAASAHDIFDNVCLGEFASANEARHGALRKLESHTASELDGRAFVFAVVDGHHDPERSHAVVRTVDQTLPYESVTVAYPPIENATALAKSLDERLS